MLEEKGHTVRSFSGGIVEVMAGDVKQVYVDCVDNESTWRVPSCFRL